MFHGLMNNPVLLRARIEQILLSGNSCIYSGLVSLIIISSVFWDITQAELPCYTGFFPGPFFDPEEEGDTFL
jgi:hypothetical protein